ncbi:MAG: CHAT domain-containing protein [Coleofasciculus sp. Co-bin14]|nr:CHAT domain-containing protein [Coleofasciculus sp. Co-bin14]
MGSVYEKLGQNQAALESYQQALLIRQEMDNRREEKAIYLDAALSGPIDLKVTIRLESGQVITFNPEGGVIFFAQQREDTLIQTGNVYRALGQNQAALESYQQAWAIVRNDETKRYEREREILERIGSVYDNLQYEDALKAYQQLLTTVRQRNSPSEEQQVLNSIGTAYKNLGQYQAALESYEQALAIVRKDKPRHSNTIHAEGTILNNIGTVYEQLGQYQAALESYKQSLAIVSASNWRQTALINIGSVSEKMGQHQAALESYEQALAIARGVHDRPVEGVTLLHKGKVYQKMGQHQTALESYQQALVILREVGNRVGEGQALNNIGEAYHHQGQYQTGLKYYQQALAVRQEVGDRTGKAVTLNNIASTVEAQSQPELAIIFYKQSVNIIEAIRQDIRGLSQAQQQSFTETVADTYRRLADLLLRQNRVLEAQRVLDLLKVQELEDYLRDVRGSDNTAQGVAERPQEQQIREGMAAEIDKAIALGKELAQLENTPVSNRTEAQKQRIVQLRQTQQEITKQFNAFLESPKVREWITQLQQTTQGQTFNLEAYGTTLQDNLKKLQQDAVILYPFVLPDRLELVLVTPYAPPLRRTVPVKREELNRAIIEFRSAVTTPVRNAKVPGQKLYNLLIKPLENDLAQAKAKTIIYAPDGQLRYIPLAALHDGKQWLVQRFRVNNITAVSLTDLNTKPQGQLQVLAAAFTEGNYSVKVGGQEFNFVGLPFAGREVEILAQTIPNTTKLLDRQFNKDIISQMNDYSIVHLATHAAFVKGQPEESFILFGNGERVTLRDVKNWRLPNVDLVVLSACQTGVGDDLGDGREILGFGYQMQQTSARAAIASLWLVHDGGTQALMNAFYTALQTGKITKAEALRQAQIALITGAQGGLRVAQQLNNSLPSSVSNNLSHPYYWAPFILIGNGL